MTLLLVFRYRLIFFRSSDRLGYTRRDLPRGQRACLRAVWRAAQNRLALRAKHVQFVSQQWVVLGLGRSGPVPTRERAPGGARSPARAERVASAERASQRF